MKLTGLEVQRIADLARIELTGREKEKYAEELSAVLGFIEQLSKVNTDNVVPTSQVTGLVNVVREDKTEDCNEDTRKQIFKAAPLAEGEYFKVKAVL
ncbi:MAG: Asp-tRNA(Asn)/Glu-tRNA(Gln) amidotransferase subunit GatC [bacterium]|nr:Asp-tRNA(Asn)/Glu-tRNA(Gln) amidotransferase subunit GatC [bacterium]